jgi:hypothetical protein
MLEGLINKQGKLAETAKQLDNVQCSDEITEQRTTDPSLRNKWFWTANTSLYRTEEGKQVLYFSRGDTSRKVNPILNNIDEATSQLIKTQNYRPSQEDINKVVDSVETGETLRIELSDLDLEKYDDEFSYFEVDVENPDILNKAQRAFVEASYGSIENLKGLGIKKTRMYVLNKDYVKENTKQGAIARACRLVGVGGGSSFGADGRNVGSSGSFLRGVLDSGEAGAKNITYKDAIRKVLEDPAETAKHLEDDDQALAMTRIAPAYFDRQKE